MKAYPNDAVVHAPLFDLYRSSPMNHTPSTAMTPERQALKRVDVAWSFESALDALILTDRQGLIVAVSGKAKKMFGYRHDELVGEPVEALMAEGFRTDYVHQRSQYSSASETQLTGMVLELYGRRKDGSEFPIQIGSLPLEANEETLVSSVIRDVSDQEHAQKLSSYPEFERVMSKLSQTFTGLTIDRIDGEITNGLKDIAEVLDLDRIAIIVADPDKMGGAVSHSWVREGVPPPPAGNIDEHYPWLASRIGSREIICVPAPEDLPQEAAAEREYMLSVGLKSWLAIPLEVGGEHLGRMSAGMFRRFQTWDSHLISRLQQAGDIFANALVRSRAAGAQRESEERFRVVADSAPVLIWMSGADKLCNFVNQSWLAFTGRTME
jgi:PAS domain S-box-containing protein